MTHLGFQGQARRPIKRAANDHDADMRSAVSATGRPCLVTLESGIQALVEIASFTYVDGILVAIGTGLAKDVDAAKWLERGPDGVRLKGVKAPEPAGPVDRETHGIKLLCLPQDACK